MCLAPALDRRRTWVARSLPAWRAAARNWSVVCWPASTACMPTITSLTPAVDDDQIAVGEAAAGEEGIHLLLHGQRGAVAGSVRHGRHAGVAARIAQAASRQRGDGDAVARGELLGPVVDRAVVHRVLEAALAASARPSPKAMSRVGVKADSTVLDPQAEISAAEAQAATTRVRRIQFAAMVFFSRKVGESLITTLAWRPHGPAAPGGRPGKEMQSWFRRRGRARGGPLQPAAEARCSRSRTPSQSGVSGGVSIQISFTPASSKPRSAAKSCCAAAAASSGMRR